MVDRLTGVDSHIQTRTKTDLLTRLETFLLELDIGERSPSTIKYYRSQAGRFVAFCESRGKLRPQDIDNRDILEFMAELKKTNTAYSMHCYYRAIRAFLNWLVREKDITESPLHFKAPMLPELKPKPYTQEDVSSLALVCSGDRFVDKRNLAIILVYTDTGIRLKEQTNLMLRDVDIKTGVIKITKGKGNKERFVKIDKKARKAVWEYLKMRTDDYPCLWVTEQGTPLTLGGIAITIKRLCKRAEIKNGKLGSHRFRHTFTDNAIRNGANLFYVQELLGHSKLDIVKLYAKNIDSERAIQEHYKFSPVEHLLK